MHDMCLFKAQDHWDKYKSMKHKANIDDCTFKNKPKKTTLIVILFILQLMKQKAHGQQDDMLIWLQITILITQSISEVKQDFGSNRRH